MKRGCVGKRYLPNAKRTSFPAGHRRFDGAASYMSIQVLISDRDKCTELCR